MTKTMLSDEKKKYEKYLSQRQQYSLLKGM